MVSTVSLAKPYLPAKLSTRDGAVGTAAMVIGGAVGAYFLWPAAAVPRRRRRHDEGAWCRRLRHLPHSVRGQPAGLLPDPPHRWRRGGRRRFRVGKQATSTTVFY